MTTTRPHGVRQDLLPKLAEEIYRPERIREALRPRDEEKKTTSIGVYIAIILCGLAAGALLAVLLP